MRMRPRSWASDTAAPWSPWAFLALFQVTICCLTQKNQEAEWANLCKHHHIWGALRRLCKRHLTSGDNWAVGNLEFKGNLFPELCFFVSPWQASILPLSLLSACMLSLFLYLVIFMAIIIELNRVSWNPTGFLNVVSPSEVRFKSFFHIKFLL